MIICIRRLFALPIIAWLPSVDEREITALIHKAEMKFQFIHSEHYASLDSFCNIVANIFLIVFSIWLHPSWWNPKDKLMPICLTASLILSSVPWSCLLSSQHMPQATNDAQGSDNHCLFLSPAQWNIQEEGNNFDLWPETFTLGIHLCPWQHLWDPLFHCIRQCFCHLMTAISQLSLLYESTQNTHQLQCG